VNRFRFLSSWHSMARESGDRLALDRSGRCYPHLGHAHGGEAGHGVGLIDLDFARLWFHQKVDAFGAGAIDGLKCGDGDRRLLRHQ
jgi:hypothetical protein